MISLRGSGKALTPVTGGRSPWDHHKLYRGIRLIPKPLFHFVVSQRPPLYPPAGTKITTLYFIACQNQSTHEMILMEQAILAMVRGPDILNMHAVLVDLWYCHEIRTCNSIWCLRICMIPWKLLSS